MARLEKVKNCPYFIFYFWTIPWNLNQGRVFCQKLDIYKNLVFGIDFSIFIWPFFVLYIKYYCSKAKNETIIRYFAEMQSIKLSNFKSCHKKSVDYRMFFHEKWIPNSVNFVSQLDEVLFTNLKCRSNIHKTIFCNPTANICSVLIYELLYQSHVELTYFWI